MPVKLSGSINQLAAISNADVQILLARAGCKSVDEPGKLGTAVQSVQPGADAVEVPVEDGQCIAEVGRCTNRWFCF